MSQPRRGRGFGPRPAHTAAPPPLTVTTPFSLEATLRDLADGDSSPVPPSLALSKGSGSSERRMQLSQLVKYLGPGVYAFVQLQEPPALSRDSTVSVLRTDLAQLPGTAIGTPITRPSAIICVPGGRTVARSERSRVSVGFFLRADESVFLRAVISIPIASIASSVVLVSYKSESSSFGFIFSTLPAGVSFMHTL